MRKVQVIGLLVAMGVAIAISAHFRPDRSAFAYRKPVDHCYTAACPAFQPVQGNNPELASPTPGANAEVPEQQADCSKAGENTKYGTNADCGIPPSGNQVALQALPQTGSGFPVTNPLTAPPDLGLAQGDPYAPIPHHHWWNQPVWGLYFGLVVSLIIQMVARQSKNKNNVAVPTAEPK